MQCAWVVPPPFPGLTLVTTRLFDPTTLYPLNISRFERPPWGWTVGLIMAEVAPDRATEILARARAFGEGRLVCGVHTLSALRGPQADDNGGMVRAPAG